MNGGGAVKVSLAEKEAEEGHAPQIYPRSAELAAVTGALPRGRLYLHKNEAERTKSSPNLHPICWQLKALHSIAEKCLHNHLFFCHKESKEPDCVCKSAAHNLPTPAFISHYARIMCNHTHSQNDLLQLFCPETVDTDWSELC